MLDGLKVGLDVLQNSKLFVCTDNQTKVITAYFMLKEYNVECKKHIKTQKHAKQGNLDYAQLN